MSANSAGIAQLFVIALAVGACGGGDSVQREAEALAQLETLLATDEWSGAEPPRNAQGRPRVVHEKTGLVFVLIPPGRFRMGSPPDEKGHVKVEELHDVTIGKAFLLSETECTQDAWDRVGGDDERRFAGDDLPIDGVSWNAAKAWVEEAGGGLRFPSEAEWEYACRAGTTTPFSFEGGDADLSRYGWFAGSFDTRDRRTGPVRAKLPNPWGLYDLHGNVSEWCEDKAPDLPGFVRIHRGGSIDDEARFCRSAWRGASANLTTEHRIGLRPAADLTPVPREPVIPMEYGEETLAAFERLLSTPEWRPGLLRRNAQGLLEADHVKTGLTFVLIPDGAFRMGTDEGPRHCGPAHDVRVPAFLLSRTECSHRAWNRVAEKARQSLRGKHVPLEEVRWKDTKAWCAKAGLRLPSEAEWEYACRAGTTTPWCTGPRLSTLVVNFRPSQDGIRHPGGETIFRSQAVRVGSLPPNPWGLHEMPGNLVEWCEDGWHPSYEGAPADGSARSGSEDGMHVARGGNWNSGAKYCLTVARGASGPDGMWGFRPAADLSGP